MSRSRREWSSGTRGENRLGADGTLPLDGNGNGRNVDPECADGEESENDFGEHDDGEGCKGEQITTAPGLRLERL